MREIIDIAISFYNLQHYGYVIGRYAIVRKEDGAGWQFILYTAVYVLFIGFIVYEVMK